MYDPIYLFRNLDLGIVLEILLELIVKICDKCLCRLLIFIDEILERIFDGELNCGITIQRLGQKLDHPLPKLDDPLHQLVIRDGRVSDMLLPLSNNVGLELLLQNVEGSRASFEEAVHQFDVMEFVLLESLDEA